MKRFVLICLILGVVFPFAACGKEPEGPQTDTSSAPPAADDTEFDEAAYLASLPDVTYEGDYKILCTEETGSTPENFFDVFEESSDVVESAVFRRNIAVEERFECRLQYTALPGNNTAGTAFATEIRTSVDAGGSLCYDLILGQNYYVLPTAVEGYLQNLLDTDQLHWEEEWYNEGINSSGAINGKLWAASGSFNMSQISYAMALFFNKDFYASEGYPYDLYELVRTNQWTYEILYELTANYYHDEGTLSGVVDDNDIFGYYYNVHGVENSILGSDVPMVFVEADGSFSIDDYYSTRLIDVFDSYYHYFNECVGTRRSSSDYVPTIMLGTGKTFFANSRVGMMIVCDEMRNSSYRIGVLPMPMYDTSQERYLTGTMRWEMFYIPRNDDLEKSATVLEYLNYTSEKYVVPAYWDNALVQKVDRAEDWEMLELIKSTLYYDFAFVYGFAMGGIYWHEGNSSSGGVKDLIEGRYNALSSWWSSNREVFRRALADVVESYG